MTDQGQGQTSRVIGDALSAEKRALLARRLRATSDGAQVLAGEPIAIIGAGCRFPGGANTLGEFWAVLRDGLDGIVPVPAERWDAAAYYDPDPLMPGKMAVQWGGFIEDVDRFDADFFTIAPREAERMDPQQRLLLEVAWDALEHAGLTRAHLAGGPTGVFVGVCTNDYQQYLLADRAAINAYVGSGTAHSIVANRLSYLLNLHGPSVAVDTACSSSLVAVHLACQALRLGDCDLALAGGVNLMLAPEPMLALAKAQMLAPDGRCKTFDARANGYARGEGCGVVVLKRLADALAAGDNVLAVVRGSAVNQDGRTTGLTAPNGLAQQAVLRRALANAGLAPEQVSFIETHGTGTSLGDPIEVEALAAVYGNAGEAPRSPVFLGAVKTNLGHLEAAAGIAGLIKAVLALHHRQIPPNVHFQSLNPNITLAGTPFVLPKAPVAWETSGQRRCAAVSSFGFGGTNAHVVLEEPPPLPPAPGQVSAAPPAFVLPISAHTPEALREMASRYHDLLLAETFALESVCQTAARHRTQHAYRLAVAGENGAALAEQLAAFASSDRDPAPIAEAPGLVCVFSGQGAEGCELPEAFIQSEPQLADALAACDAALRPHLGWSVTDYLTGRRPDLDWRDTAVAQPVMFTVQVSLAALWRAWGLVPEAVVGHSVGEIAAAQVAGSLSMEDAAWLVCQRGRLMQQAHGGGRAASIQASPAEAETLARRYPGRVFVGAINSPVSAILSGEAAALAEIEGEWQAAGRFFRFLPVAYAFHSEPLRPLADELARLADGLAPRAAEIPMVSTVTGGFCGGPELGGRHWARNLAERVRFADAMQTLLAAGHAVFLEIGPHPLLQRPMQQCLAAHGDPARLAASLRQGQPPALALRQGLAALYMAGVEPDWGRCLGPRQRPVELPPYAWQRRRFWTEVRSAGPRQVALPPGQHPFLGAVRHSPLRAEVVFDAELDDERLPLLHQHRVFGAQVVPAVVLIDMVLSAAVRGLAAEPPLAVEQVVFQVPVRFEPGQPRNVQCLLQPEGPHSATFSIHSAAIAAGAAPVWTEHARGRVRWQVDDPQPMVPGLAALRASLPDEVEASQLYAGFRARGLDHDAAYRHVVSVRVGGGAALGRIEVEPWPTAELAGAGEDAFLLAPPLLESCLQVVAAPLLAAAEADNALYLPLALDRLVYHRRPGRGVWCHAQLASPVAENGASPETYAAGVSVVGDDGTLVATVEGLRLKRAALEAVQRAASPGSQLDEGVWQVEWQPLGELPALANTAGDGAWLIIAGAPALAEALKSRCEAAGQPYVVALSGGAFEQRAHRVFAYHPARPEDFDRLWQAAVVEPGRDCTAVLYLAGDDGQGALPGALHAAQMLARHASPATRLWMVTNDSHGSPASAGLSGLAAAFALEHEAHWGGLIALGADVPLPQAAEAISREMSARAEDHVALRGNGRFGARLRPLRLDAESRVTLRPDRTYLVTGGLGALGRHVVLWLVEQGARHVALASRRAPDSAEADRLRAELPESAALHHFQTDVSDRSALAGVLAALQRNGPPLAGIFHLAGVLDDGVLLQQTWDRFARVLTPKSEAAWHLQALTADLPLDHFVLFSSVAGVLGAAGQANYAAANASLDALAHYRRAQGLPALSLDWSVWQGDGMAGRLAATERARLDTYGLQPIAPERGLALMSRLLAADVAQALVMPVNWQRFAQALPGWQGRSLLREVLPVPSDGPAEASAAERERLGKLPPPERREALLVFVSQQVGRVLGLAPGHGLDRKRGFFQLGMDSLMAVELQRRLQQALGVTLPATAVFDYPNPESLGRYLEGLLWPAATEANGHAPEAADAALAAALHAVESLTEAELDAMLRTLERDEPAAHDTGPG